MLETRTIQITEDLYNSVGDNQHLIDAALKKTFYDITLDMPEIDCGKSEVCGICRGRRFLIGDVEDIYYDLEEIEERVESSSKHIKTIVKFPLKYTFKFHNPINEWKGVFSDLVELEVKLLKSQYSGSNSTIASTMCADVGKFVKGKLKEGYEIFIDKYEENKDSLGCLALPIYIRQCKEVYEFRAVGRADMHYKGLVENFRNTDRKYLTVKIRVPKDCLKKKQRKKGTQK